MKIDPKSLNYIQNVVKTAELAKINNIIIEPGKIRAIDEDRTVVIFQDKDVPDMPFGSIGINRIDVFSDRFDIARTMDGFNVDAVVNGADTDTPWAKALTFKGKGIKVDYRCANPLTIQAPKSLNDGVKFEIRMNPEALALMQKGQTAMRADVMTLFGGPDGVFFEMADINSDALTYKFADDFADVSGGNDTEFTHKYKIKTLLPLFKSCPTSQFYLTTRGMLKLSVNNLDVYVIPSV